MHNSSKTGAELNRIVGTCLRAEREARGMSMLQLSARLGITNAALCYIELGHVRMRVDTLIKACVAMGSDPLAVLTEIMKLTTDVPRETSL